MSHAKHKYNRAFFTPSERRDAGYGSIKKRIGRDAQLPFGYCQLSLQPARQPVASPSGRIYDKAMILEYLITKRKEIAAQRAEWQRQQAGQEQTRKASASSAEAARLAQFAALEEGKGRTQARSEAEAGAAASPKTGEERLRQLAVEKRDRFAMSRDERLDAAGRVSFWVPQYQPSAAAAAATKPPKHPPSPFSGRPLKAKQLVPIKFSLDRSGEGGLAAAAAGAGTAGTAALDAPSAAGGGAQDADEANDAKSAINRVIVCAVSGKEITHHDAVLLVPSGRVIRADVFKTLVKPTMVCPLTSRPLREQDVRPLVSGGTAFAAHNNVEAETYRPSL